MTWLRRIAFPFGLAWARLTRRSERVVFVTLGIAAGAALLAAVLAGSLVAQDRSVELTLALRNLPPDRARETLVAVGLLLIEQADAVLALG